MEKGGKKGEGRREAEGEKGRRKKACIQITVRRGGWMYTEH